MEFEIRNTSVYGLKESEVASGNSMRTEIESVTNYSEKDQLRSSKLGACPIGAGHDQFLTGIIVQMDVYAPLYWWKQAQRYNWFTFVSSQSTMHKLTEFDIKKECVSAVDPAILQIYQSLINKYKEKDVSDPEKEAYWYKLVASLPCGFVLGARITTNYRQLKTMYSQRKNHKLVEWHTFCKWCDSLPQFTLLTNNAAKPCA